MALALCCASLVGAEERLPRESTIRIMSFNIWRDGNGGKQPLSQTAKVIQIAKADIVGLQEAKPATVKALADRLGWHHRGTVLSRFKIVANKGLPFDVKVPNADTVAAMSELRDPKSQGKLKSHTSVDDLMSDLKLRWSRRRSQKSGEAISAQRDGPESGISPQREHSLGLFGLRHQRNLLSLPADTV